MTARTTFSQADMQRAIRAAEACGKVAVLTTAGIVFAPPDKVALPSQDGVQTKSEVRAIDMVDFKR